MKNRGDILLISCYELGHQPLALASPLGFLRAAGYHPGILDLSVEMLNAEKISRAKFIGISVPMHTALRLGVGVAREIRMINPQAHLCFYGLYAHLNREFLLRHEADSVVGGEFELTILETIQALEAGKGISIPENPVLEKLPFVKPSREELPPLSKYAQLEEAGGRRLAAAVEASRGCKHLCRHCPIPPVYGGRFFVVPKEIILQDIRQLVEAGATHITFADADFLNGPRHSREIVRAMHQEFPSLTFDITTKIEHILQHSEIFSELREMGCLFVISAVESLNDQVLSALRKGHDKEDVFQALQILKQVGIPLRPSLVPFTPWETLESYIELLDWVETEELFDHIDPVHFSIRLLVPPGSSLLEAPDIQPYLGPLEESTFSYEWYHPDPRMERLQKKVATIVEGANSSEEEARTTFEKIKSVAYAMAEKKCLSHPMPLSPGPKPPRLTETWFCCAEPTVRQLIMAEKSYP